MIRVLYVDDEPDLLEVGRLFLEIDGSIEVATARSATEGLQKMAASAFHAVIADYQMPGLDGIGMLKEVRSRFGSVPFILFTGRGREEIVIQALNHGADFYLQKGGDATAQFAELRSKIVQAVKRREAEVALSESETRFRSLAEGALDTIMLFDRQLRHLYVNPIVEKQTGIPRAKFFGKTHADLGFPPALVATWETALRRVFDGGGTERLEFQLPGGIWIDWLLVPVIGPDGAVNQVISSARDITARKHAEQALQENEARLRSLFDQAFQLAGLLDTQGNVVRVNEAALAFLGCEAVAVMNRPFWDTPWWTHDPEEQAKVRDAVARASRGESVRFETTHRNRDGLLRDIDFSLKPIVNDRGSVIALLPEGRDITDRKTAERDLQESRDLFRAAIDHSYDAVFVHEPDGRVIDVNTTMLKMYRVTYEEALRYTIEDYTGPASDMAEVRRSWERVLQGEDVFFPWQARRPKDGSLFDVEVFLTRIVVRGQPLILGNVRDVTERNRSERRVKESEELYRSLVELTDTAYVILDSRGRVIRANDEYLKLTGRPDLAAILGQPVTSWTAPHDLRRNAAELERCLMGGLVRGLRIDYLRPDGSLQRVELDATVVRSRGEVVILTLCRGVSAKALQAQAEGR